MLALAQGRRTWFYHPRGGIYLVAGFGKGGGIKVIKIIKIKYRKIP